MENYIPFEIFVHVVEYGGITAAARSLKLSKAAISRTIKVLEQQCKTDLFYRRNRSLYLTEIGEELYTQCKQLQIELNDIRSYLKKSQQKPRGTLTIAVPSFVLENFIFPKLKAFCEKYSDLEIVFDNSETTIEFDHSNIDLAFGYSITSDSLLITRKKIGSTRYVICGTQQYFSQHGIPKKIIDLNKHVYIAHTMRDATQLLELKEEQHHTLKIHPRLQFNNTKEMIACCLNHIGIIQSQYFMVEKYLQRNELIEVLPDFSISDVPLYLYYKKHRYTQPKIRAFIDYFSVE